MSGLPVDCGPGEDPGQDPHVGREALRQALLLRALWQQAPEAALAGWLRDAPPRVARGLSAYRSNGAAIAARSLAAAFPTVEQIVGADSFDALARAFWHAAPPARGDLAEHGAGLPDFIAVDEQLADVPWLADSARLDWAVHRAESSADATRGSVEGLERLGGDDPGALRLSLQPGTALIASRWPIATIWRSHREMADDRFAAVREALAAGRAESALVWRDGWRPRVDALAEPDAQFTAALLAECPLAQALDAAGPDFQFEPWLLDALRHGRLAAVQCHAGGTPLPGDS